MEYWRKLYNFQVTWNKCGHGKETFIIDIGRLAIDCLVGKSDIEWSFILCSRSMGGY